MPEFAYMFKELGCVSAYNLDGGGSSVMVFNNQLVNKPMGVLTALGVMLIVAKILTELTLIPLSFAVQRRWVFLPAPPPQTTEQNERSRELATHSS